VERYTRVLLRRPLNRRSGQFVATSAFSRGECMMSLRGGWTRCLGETRVERYTRVLLRHPLNRRSGFLLRRAPFSRGECMMSLRGGWTRCLGETRVERYTRVLQRHPLNRRSGFLSCGTRIAARGDGFGRPYSESRHRWCGARER
jgi:hypothetical protein